MQYNIVEYGTTLYNTVYQSTIEYDIIYMYLSYCHHAHSAPLDSKMDIVPVNSWELIFVALKICGAVIIIFASYYTINKCF